MIPSFIGLFILIGAFLVIRKQYNSNKWIIPSTPFPKEWRKILVKKVAFYNSLTQEEKSKFEFEIQEFLLNYRITGISTTIDITDKLLVAASGVIPIFKFPDWKYADLHEVLVYPNSFNEDFETSGKNRAILGMVGTGYMNNTMILSKKALHLGFSNERDKKNTAIHEFVHLIDKSDGAIDGIPSILLEKQYTIPWLELINVKIEDIYKSESDINPYGGTNKAEFFSVVSEYFFERPKLLQKKHPKLYKLLEQAFNHSMSNRNMKFHKNTIRRNDICPCGSGEKYKKCCGKTNI